ncbi:MAG: peptidylprolyl isomerase [Planctomycetota bacterium]
MRDKVRELWPEIVFEKDGKPVEYVATLETDEGPIVIEFYPKDAPNHVRNFIALAKAGFYDGLIFHRCIKGFMIQGGCPEGRGSGGPGYDLKAEFNGKTHKRGVLSMARAQDPDSAGSQFFICVAPAEFLDRQYSAFGEVKSGMEAVDKIVARPTGREDRPRTPVKINSVKISVKGEEPAK